MSENINLMVHRAAERHFEIARNLSDSLWAAPELSGAEYESSKAIAEILRRAGYDVEYPYLGFDTAFNAVLGGGAGPKAAILVEYDALPEIGHACGHNLHGALSVLTGLILAELKDSFQGSVYVVGTPAEEDDGAKIGMSEKGIFDGMALAAMMHSSSGGVSQPDMDALSLRCYRVEFKGRTAHSAAAPWEGRSALTAARKFMDLIDARRECFTPDIRVSGIITDGGKATNIIPDRAEIRVEFRTASMKKLELLDAAILKCAKGSAMAFDCEVSWEKAVSDFADMVRVPLLESEAARLMAEKGLRVGEVSPPIGSTDVGNVSYRCPSIQPLLSITEEPLALHTVKFADATKKAPAYSAMQVGAETLALLVLRVMNDESFRTAVQSEFASCRSAKL